MNSRRLVGATFALLILGVSVRAQEPVRRSRFAIFMSYAEARGVPTPDATRLSRLKAYLDGSDEPRFESAFQALVHYGERPDASLLVERTHRIAIDGDPLDWEKSGFTTSGEGFSGPSDSSKPMAPLTPESRVSEFGVAHAGGIFRCMVRPERMPEAGHDYRFIVNVISGDAILCSFVWSSSGDFFYVWNPITKACVASFSSPACSFAAGSAFEASAPTSLVASFPSQYKTQAVCWSIERNSYHALTNPSTSHAIDETFATSPIEVLFGYAGLRELRAGDPDPLIMAVCEAPIYRLAGAELRMRILKDGLDYLDEAKLSPLPDDIPLRANILDRGGMHGAYNDFGYKLSDGGTMSSEAYSFMFPDAECLRLAKEFMAAPSPGSASTIAEAVRSTEMRLWELNRYRRANLADIETVYRANPSDPAMKRMRVESIAEHASGDVNVTTVDGKPINKGAVWSPAFQLRYLAAHGFFYGNCVDVAAVAQLVYKSRGIPSVTVTYGTLVAGKRTEFHTFPLWRSNADGLWYPYLRGGNPADGSGIGKSKVYYFVESAKNAERGGMCTAANPSIASLAEWRRFNASGFRIEEDWYY